MSRNVDQIVKDKLRGLEKEPPAYVWSAINDQMLRNSHRKRVLIFWQSIAAVALLILSIGITYFYTNNKTVYDQVAVSETTVQPDQEATNINSNPQTGLIGTVSVASNKTEQKKGYTDKNPNSVSVVKSTNSTEKARSAQQKNTSITNNTPSAKPLMAMQSSHKNKESANMPANNGTVADELLTLKSTRSFTYTPEVPTMLVATTKKKKHLIYPLYASNTPAYQPNTKRHKFVITGSVSPTYNYRNIERTHSSVVTVTNSSYDESGVVSVAGGVNIRMESKSRWSFETGVLYSQVGQEVSQTNIYPSLAGVSSLAAYSDSRNLKTTAVNISHSTSNSLGEIKFPQKTPMAIEKGFQKNGVYLVTPMETLDQQPAATTLKQLLDYIEIPFNVRYALLDTKTLITISGGLSTNFLVDNSAYIVENGEQIDAGSTEGISPVTYSSSVGLGIELPLGKSFRFSLEPRFKYFLSPVNSNGYSNFHPYSFGVFGGVSFLLGH